DRSSGLYNRTALFEKVRKRTDCGNFTLGEKNLRSSMLWKRAKTYHSSSGRSPHMAISILVQSKIIHKSGHFDCYVSLRRDEPSLSFFSHVTNMLQGIQGI
ncbi:MAG TPA: hypothetical protein VFM05_13725, partial [Candidatus Saccharimonadales bacterium]|nr:hypothetical protein [Candidatus Saccharimonadales bacterium]